MAGRDVSFRIETLTAYTQIDEGDEEGLVGFLTADGTWMPMIAADHVRLANLRDRAQLVADATGRPVRVRRFTTAVEVETLTPRSQS